MLFAMLALSSLLVVCQNIRKLYQYRLNFSACKLLSVRSFCVPGICSVFSTELNFTHCNTKALRTIMTCSDLGVWVFMKCTTDRLSHLMSSFQDSGDFQKWDVVCDALLKPSIWPCIICPFAMVVCPKSFPMFSCTTYVQSYLFIRAPEFVVRYGYPIKWHEENQTL